jgi:hypothetical protein
MDSEGWIDIPVIASFNRVQSLTHDVDLVRDAMSLSAFLEVSENKVRLAHRRWQDFVLPPTPSLAPASQHSSSPSLFHLSGISTPGMRSSAAYSLAASLSNLALSGDDAATIQAKVTEAVLGTKSSMRHIAEIHGRDAGTTQHAVVGNGHSVPHHPRVMEPGNVPSEPADESASNTAADSQMTDALPAVGTSSPSSPQSLDVDLPKRMIFA